LETAVLTQQPGGPIRTDLADAGERCAEAFSNGGINLMERIDRMSISQCRFVWYDLATSDSNAAAKFYENVVGWKINDAGMPDRSYAILSTDTSMVGGLMALSK
jgi:hypothetical protein